MTSPLIVDDALGKRYLKGKAVLQLRQGEAATIEPNDKHYYHNVSGEECILKVTIDPGSAKYFSKRKHKKSVTGN